ncbi:response regulator [Leptothoe kymatousa]|uniref:Response regulator n=1 Tax=Leptothoe kymatousa TAU-MAC 1615 TaxID=2364775 RepID=A0ABS5Y4T9_9CYAN|nr:response regulator [Leptothoe kymatousa]MBT9312374.1 response regulator [Leptothoe kymatousa TAU-MAC 1615]
MTESAVNTLTLEHGISVPQLIKNVKAIIQTQTNGYIQLKTSSGEQWWLEFRVGQLLWAGGGQHRFRRWQRLLKTYCPEIRPSDVRLRERELFDHWEYIALSVLLKRQQIDREVAISMIEATIAEVIFDICQTVDQLTQISHSTNRLSRLPEPIAILSSTTLFYNVKTQLAQWQKTNLSHLSPNLAPSIVDNARLEKHTQPRTYQILKRLIQGNRSLRELSQITGRDLCELGRMVGAYVQRDIIELNILQDLAQPYDALDPKVPSQSAQQLPHIFCIDNNPQVGYLMEETLRPAGYRCTSIQDSIHALTQILRYKPNLIFLALKMPVANGYEICKQVRRVKAFKDTPIVILTGNDSLMDRMRAKAVGATDFITKPVDPTKIVEMVRYQLAEQHDQIEEAG